MEQHVSVRDFKDQALSSDTKQQLLRAAQSGSSSNFVQAFSIIEVSDKEIKNEIADITNSAAYVKKTGVFYVFVADLYRQSIMLQNAGKSLKGIENMEALTVATVDATIAGEDMAVAAESMDLGICYIGGVRNDVARIAELLNLPKYTFPVFGMTIGIPNHKNQVKPRMPLENQVSVNKYDVHKFADIEGYDKQIEEYYANRDSNAQAANWTSKNVNFFEEVRRPEVGEFLKRQGFALK
nr:NADPH-dependent oxidoreductase [Companilactobacillus ginsenosidimutans]